MSKRRLSRNEFLRLSAMFGAGAALAACGTAPAVAPTAVPAAATKAPAAPAATTAPSAPAAAATTAPAAGATTAPAAAATKPAAAATTAPAAAAKPAASVDTAPPTGKFAKISKTMPAKFTESPFLAERVKAGKLPPIEQRLPTEPLVVEPAEIGQYGGNLRCGSIGTDFIGWDVELTGGAHPQFLRIDPDLQNFQYNVAKELIVSDDKKTFTLKLRKGMKFSDGQPFGAKDYMFWYEDMLQNKEFTPSISPWFMPGGKLMECTAPDEETIIFKFAIPNPIFVLTNLAHIYGWWVAPIFPAHYLKKYHIKYNPKANEDAKAAKYDNWYSWFRDISERNRNKDLPSLRAIIVTEVSPTQVKFERNPYYWAVDTQGQQLPYIDTQEMEFLSSLEMLQTKIVTGTYDFAGGQTNILNYAAYQSGAAAGKYKVLLWQSGKGGEVFYQVNMTHPEAEIAKVHQDVRFRRALSMAINRDEINQLIYFGKAQPRAMTVIPLSKYYKKEYETAWAEYSPDKANALLDEMGLKWDAAKKTRLFPSGKPISYQFDMVETETPKGPVTELVAEYWRKVGIDIKYKSITRQLLTPRIMANEEPMSLWHGDAVTDILLPADRKWVTGRYGDETALAIPWHQWYDTQGAQGVEPPPWFKEVLETFRKFSETLDPAQADKLLKYQADNVWSIGTVGMAPVPIIVRNNLINVAESGIWTWDDLWTWPYHAETWFFKK